MVKPYEVKAKAQRLEEQNYKFRTFLKNHANDEELDAQFLSLHNELFAGYDCSKCANCCKTYEIILGNDESKRIAAFLKMDELDFVAKYLANAEPDDENHIKLRISHVLFYATGAVGFKIANRTFALDSLSPIILIDYQVCTAL